MRKHTNWKQRRIEKRKISKKSRRNITGFEEGTVEEKKPREGRSPRNLEAP